MLMRVFAKFFLIQVVPSSPVYLRKKCLNSHKEYSRTVYRRLI